MTEAVDGYFEDGEPIADLPAWEVDRLTTELGMGDNGPLVNRAFAEALPFQFDRELVKNALEANATKVVIGVDWLAVERAGIYPFMVADNGDGMADEEEIRFFNLISSSGKVMDPHGNFGVGAKVSLLPWNGKGVIVMSWKNGVGSMIKMLRKPSGNYALRRWPVEHEDGSLTYEDVVEAPAEYKPDFIEDHGTVILALGNTGAEDTIRGPDGTAGSKAHTLALNRRFFEIPDGVEIRVHELPTDKKQDWPKKFALLSQEHPNGINRRQILGAKHFLGEFAIDSGTVAITGARVHWWLLEDSQRRKNVNSYAEHRSYVAALHGNELYNLAPSSDAAARAIFQQFGLYRHDLYRDVTIVVEADPWEPGTLTGVVPNTPRSQLLYGGADPLPWSQWGAEFIRQMPDELRALLEHHELPVPDPKELKERLAPFLKRMRPIQWRPDPAGAEVGPEPNARGGVPRPRREHPRRPVPQHEEGGPGGRAGVNRVGHLDPAGQRRVTSVRPQLDLPRPTWVSLGNGRAEGELEGRAASYADNLNVLLINADFLVFEEMVAHFAGEHTDKPGAEGEVRKAVREVYETDLIARVVHARMLEGARDWPRSAFEVLLSEESLTMAVLGLVGAHAQIARLLGHRLGSVRRLREAADG